MALRQYLDTLLHYDPTRSSSTVNVWISHPTPVEEQALGKLVVITSFTRLTRVNHEMIGLIQEELRSQYYQSTDTLPDVAFKRALKGANDRIHEVVSEGIDQWVAGANILVVATHHQSLWLAHVGHMEAHMVRQEHIVTLVGSADRETPNPLRMFSSTVSGQLLPQDRILLCTPSLLDYFSLEKIRRVLIDGRPSDIVHQLESTLLSADPTYAVAAVVMEFDMTAETVHASPRSFATPNRPGVSAPQASIDSLLERQRQTEKILTPSVWPAVSDVLRRTEQGLSSFFRVTLMRRPPRRTLSPFAMESQATPHRTAPSGPSLWTTIAQTLKSSWARVRAIRLRRPQFRNALPEFHAPASPREAGRSWLHRTVRWFQGLKKTQQWAALVAILLVLSLSTALAQRNTGSHSNTSASSPADQIRSLIAQAQAALLYGGEATAVQATQQADGLLNQVPQRTKTEKTSRQQLVADLQKLHLQLNHLTTITTSPLIADLSSVPQPFQPRQLYLAGTSLVTLDPIQNAVVSTSLSTKKSALIANTLDTGVATTGAIINTNTLLVATDRQTFASVNLTTKAWKPVDAAFPKTNPRVQTLATYQNRLYALDTNHNDIVRFAISTNSLGQGASWLKTTATLAQARGAAVDGSIYVLQPNGKIQEFQNGKPAAFTIGTVTPALSNPTRLWTDLNATHLYLLDPDNKRLVVFDKNGRLADQYQSSQWTDLRDLVINEKTKTAYLLNGQKILSLTLLQ